MPGQRGKASGEKKARQDNGGPRDPWTISDPLAESRWLREDDRREYDEHSSQEELSIETTGISKITSYIVSPLI